MGKKIIFATNNSGKMKEITEIMGDLKIPVYSMRDVGVDMDIVEDGETFEDNALIKARALAKIFPDDIILADDSGLEVDYLDKGPGVHTALFAGRDTPYMVKNQVLIEKLKDAPEEKRTARFVCVIAAIFPDGTIEITKGKIEGEINKEMAGDNGFGYDPIFYVPEYGCTTAQMSRSLKNQLSHRGKALEMMKKIIRGKVNENSSYE